MHGKSNREIVSNIIRTILDPFVISAAYGRPSFSIPARLALGVTTAAA